MPEADFSREQICAHRGASGAYPENTHAAFNAAASVGANWIETDIQCLADQELAIFHDTHLGRTAPGSTKVTSLSGLKWPSWMWVVGRGMHLLWSGPCVVRI